MHITKAMKVRLYPDRQQTILINKTFGCCRYVYNHMLIRNDKIYRRMEEHLSGYDMCYLLPDMKKYLTWLILRIAGYHHMLKRILTTVITTVLIASAVTVNAADVSAAQKTKNRTAESRRLLGTLMGTEMADYGNTGRKFGKTGLKFTRITFDIEGVDKDEKIGLYVSYSKKQMKNRHIKESAGRAQGYFKKASRDGVRYYTLTRDFVLNPGTTRFYAKGEKSGKKTGILSVNVVKKKKNGTLKGKLQGMDIKEDCDFADTFYFIPEERDKTDWKKYSNRQYDDHVKKLKKRSYTLYEEIKGRKGQYLKIGKLRYYDGGLNVKGMYTFRGVFTLDRPHGDYRYFVMDENGNRTKELTLSAYEWEREDEDDIDQ